MRRRRGLASAGLPRRRAGWLRGLLAVAVLGVVVWRVGSGPFLAGLAGVDLRSLTAAGAVAGVTTLCSAWRWTLVARGLGAQVPLGAAVAACYRSQFVNVATPGGMLGDVDRAVRHGRAVGDTSLAVRAVAYERLAGQAVLLVMVAPALCALDSPVRAPARVAVAGVLVAAALAVLVPGARTRVRRGWARTARLGGIRPGLLPGGARLGIVVASALAVCGYVLTLLLAARTAGSSAATLQLLPLALVVLAAAGLPNIAGWGPREGVAAWAFAAAGLGAQQGVATAVAYGVMVFVAALPGALLLVAGGVRRLTRRAEPVLGRSAPARAPAAGGASHA